MLLPFPTALSSLCVPDIEEGKGPYLHALCVEKGEGVTLSTVHRGGRGSDTAYCREGLTLPTTHRGSGVRFGETGNGTLRNETSHLTMEPLTYGLPGVLSGHHSCLLQHFFPPQMSLLSPVL